jgi:hypothetical protein
MTGVAHNFFVWDAVLIGCRHESCPHAVWRDGFPDGSADLRLSRALSQNCRTASGSSRPEWMDPQRSTFLKIGPEAISACSSQVFKAMTGQV